MLSSTNALDFLAAHEMPGDSMIPVAPGGSEIAEITSAMTFLRLTLWKSGSSASHSLIMALMQTSHSVSILI